MGSQVIGEDRSRLPGRETAREVSRGGIRASDRTKERVHRFRRDRKASRLPYLSLGDDRRSGDVNLAIFITFVSGSKCLASFTNRFFYFSGPPGFRMAFDAAERNGAFGSIHVQRSKESSSRGKRRVFLCRRTVRVKVIPSSFLKIEGWRTLVGAKDRREREGQLKELVGDQNSSLEAPPRSKRGGSKGYVRRGSMENNRYVRIIERKEIRRDDPIKYFLPTGSEVPFESQRG